VDSGRARPPNALQSVHAELKIMPLVTQNQQATTSLSHNWNSELTLYVNYRSKSCMEITDNLIKSWCRDTKTKTPP